jgi:uncharacterized protein (TIGR02231 family)
MPEPIRVESKISSVTVFLDRARVTREAEAVLPAGASTLQIPNLPNTLRAESVRVKGRGTGVRIIAIDVSTEYLAQTPEKSVAELQAQLEALEDRQRGLNDRTAIEDQRVKMAAALRVSASTDLVKGLAYGRTTIESIDALAKYAAAQDAEARESQRAISLQMKTLVNEIEAVKARLRQVQQPSRVVRRTIQVEVEADAPDTKFSFEANYVVGNATWTPLYDARLQDDKLDLTYLAMVSQSSGEDWNDVDLSLSTARPAVTTEVPELSPWFLDVYVPRPMRAAAPQAKMMRSMAGGAAPEPEYEAAIAMSAELEAPAPVAEEIQATADRQGASVTFRMPRRTGIPSDLAPHRVQIAKLELPARLDYITAPTLAEQAYLRAKIDNNSGFVLLPGEANLFHGDEYVGATQIEDTAAREFELQMGVDERVSVTRELVGREVSKAFIGSTKKTQYTYRIRITHQLVKAAKITVLDQIPHSRHEDIKVKLLDTSPRVSEQTDLSELRWNLTLEPAKTQEIQFGFSVEFPKTLQVLGLSD